MQVAGRILAVDDNPTNLRVLKSLLGAFTLTTVESGIEAMQVAPTFRPDVILLDIMMPGIDGYETCRRIRGTPALRHSKIIMLSAKSELSQRLAGYSAGADDYLTKPFDCDELLAKVRVYLKLKSIEEVEEIKNRTIEVLQHSNRTPLNNIICYAELLKSEGELNDDLRIRAPEVILRNARRLHQLLEKGEMLASLKSGRFYFDFTTGEIRSVVQNVLTELAARMAERRLRIEADMPVSAEAQFDEVQLQFLIRALIDNAVRFSRSGGTIRIQLRRMEEDWILSVTDDGEGVPYHLMPHVFEPFGNPESPLFNQGDGLSLAIAQQIAWAHNGDLRVESDFGHGATFSLRIPASTPQGRCGPPDEERKGEEVPAAAC